MPASIDVRHTLHVLSEFMEEVGIVASPVPSLEEERFRPVADYSHYKIELVEEDAPDQDLSHPDHAPEMHLRYFTDGVQRTQLVGHFLHEGYHVPVHYCIAASIILQREALHFNTWQEPTKREFILVPFAFVPGGRKLISKYHEVGLDLVDSGVTTVDYNAFRAASTTKARELRQELERELNYKWLDSKDVSNDEYLVVDGSILDYPNDRVNGRFVGYSKAANLNMGDLVTKVRHLNLTEFTRSRLFKVVDPDGGKDFVKYSWFLKIRENAKLGPEFGLIRPEISTSKGEDPIKKAKDISYLLVVERLPILFPATKWDKLIYPVRLCTRYLSAILPTVETVQSYFGGL
jgi:hypothetical protein